MDAKLIPGTKGFMASSKGVIYDPLNRVKKQYINGDGYKTVAVIVDNGKWQTFGVHRLVALAHLVCKENPNIYVVNHRDHNKINNDVSNLEWTTDEFNNMHAALFNGCHAKPSIIAKSPDGKHELIANIQKVAKRFGYHESLIWDSIRNNTTLDGWLFKPYNTKQAKPVDLHKPKMNGNRVNGRLKSKSVEIKDVETETVIEFNSIWQAADYFNTTSSHIYKSISNTEQKRLFKGKYLIITKGDTFPVLSEREFQTLRSSVGKEVIAFNEVTKQLIVYESASKFITSQGLSKKAVTVSLKNNRLRKVSDWWFIYNTKENNDRLKAIIDRPGS